jgi:hypothetical protein
MFNRPRDRLERWILTYLGTTDLDMQGGGRAYVDIRTITKLIPKEVFPEVKTQENIMEAIRDMEKYGNIVELHFL